MQTGNLAVMSDGLRNAAQAIDNFSLDNIQYNEIQSTFQEHSDFSRINEDLTFHWNENGVQQSLSVKAINDFMNGEVMVQISQLLETVSNLEEKIEAMEYYNEEADQAA
jgi:hypothetical protein